MWRYLLKELINDLEIKLPTICYGSIAPRSGLALHHHINVIGNAIDENYRCNVCMVLFNYSDKPFHVSRGDRVAQLICQTIYYPDLEELQELDDTERGKKGFVSTGRN